MNPETIIYDMLARRATTAGFIMNWPYRVLRNAIEYGRFHHAERIRNADSISEE